MKREILHHDVENATAIIRFTHNGVSQTDNYSLIHLVPGTAKVYADLGMEFDEEAQLRAIEYLQRHLIPVFETGQVHGDPEGSQPIIAEPIEPTKGDE